MRMKFIAVATVAACASFGALSAQATEFVTNGGYETSSYGSNSQFGASYGGQGVTGWTGSGGQHLEFYYIAGTQTTVNAVNQYNDPKGYLWAPFGLSNQGGNFVGLDAGAPYQGVIEQQINGLIIGGVYNLSFEWAGGQLQNRDGATFDQIEVQFGTDDVLTSQVNVPSHGFTGWMSQSYSFTASATSQTLRFLAVGGPGELPPIAAIDGISLTGGVPEPASWALMLTGFGGLGVVLRRRRSRTALTA
jgi:hypothetical protein